jgi:hypothetical protein
MTTGSIRVAHLAVDGWVERFILGKLYYLSTGITAERETRTGCPTCMTTTLTKKVQVKF